jgi:branched-chain amino acid transport system permease protein
MKKAAPIIIGLCILFVLLALAQNFLAGYYLRLVVLFGINIILTVSLNITNGYAGIFSLGHGGIMLAAGYASVLLTLPVDYKQRMLHLPLWLENAHLPFIPAMIVGSFVAVLVSIVLILPAFRLRGHYFILASIGINIIMTTIAENIPSITHGAMGLRNIPAYTTIWWVYGIVVLLIYTIWILMHSKFGRAFVSIGKDQRLAETLGINLVRHKIYAFMVSSFFTGLGGILWTHLILTLSPTSFSLFVVFQIVMMMVIGGIGSLTGSIVGAAIITVFTELLAPLQEGIKLFGIQFPPMFGLVQVLLAVFLILVMIYRPVGLTGGKEFSFSKISNRFRNFK